MKRTITFGSLLLLDCAVATKKVLVPLAFLLTATPVLADTSLEASWDVVAGDGTNYEYTLYADSTNPPTKVLWFGRDTITTGNMKHTFLFSQTGLLDSVPQVCSAVKVTNKTTGKTSGISNVSCVVGDFSPPAPLPPLNFRLNAK